MIGMIVGFYVNSIGTQAYGIARHDNPITVDNGNLSPAALGVIVANYDQECVVAGPFGLAWFSVSTIRRLPT